jgi:cytochrome d ubiquinol oxidase subunit II
MVMFWVSLLAISILLYVLLDGVDLGVGLLFGLANGEARRGAMLSAVAPIWDGNETWLVVTAVICGEPFRSSMRLCCRHSICLSSSCCWA